MPTITGTIEDRFNAAVSAAAEAGVRVCLNDDSACCQGCFTFRDGREVFEVNQFGDLRFDDNGDPRFVLEDAVECDCTSDEYEYDDEDNETQVYEGRECDLCRGLVSGTEYRVVSSIWFYFQKLNSARVWADALRTRGFAVNWDGTQEMALELVF